MTVRQLIKTLRHFPRNAIIVDGNEEEIHPLDIKYINIEHGMTKSQYTFKEKNMVMICNSYGGLKGIEINKENKR